MFRSRVFSLREEKIIFNVLSPGHHHCRHLYTYVCLKEAFMIHHKRVGKLGIWLHWVIMDYRCVIHRNLIIARGNPLADNIFSDEICLVGISLESEIESFLSMSSLISLSSNVSFSIYHLTCRGWHAVLAIYLCISCSCKIILWTCFLVFTSRSLHFQNRILEVF